MNRLEPPSKAGNAGPRQASAIRIALLILVPVAPVAAYGFQLAPIWIFLAGIAGIAILAEWIRVATEQLALHVGPTVGGLLTVSLGSLAELVLAMFVLARGEIEVVHAQITGSIMGTCLLGLGLAIVVGGLTREHQRFKRARTGLMSSMLMLVVIALLLPAVFDYTSRSVLHAPSVDVTDETLSLAVSAVLLLLYVGNLVYTLVTHRDVFASGETSGERPRWSTAICLMVLAAATAGAALESELVAGALTETARTLGLTPLFMGVVVLALVGTSADIFAAVWFARRDRMGLVMTICIGSGIQVALVVAPLLVIFSWLFGNPMTLVFRNPSTFSRSPARPSSSTPLPEMARPRGSRASCCWVCIWFWAWLTSCREAAGRSRGLPTVRTRAACPAVRSRRLCAAMANGPIRSPRLRSTRAEAGRAG